MYMYRVIWSGINKTSIVRSTDKSVWYISDRGNEFRENKRGQLVNWFDTFDEAKKFLIDEINFELGSLEVKTSAARQKLSKLKQLQENKVK